MEPVNKEGTIVIQLRGGSGFIQESGSQNGEKYNFDICMIKVESSGLGNVGRLTWEEEGKGHKMSSRLQFYIHTCNVRVLMKEKRMMEEQDIGDRSALHGSHVKMRCL